MDGGRDAETISVPTFTDIQNDRISFSTFDISDQYNEEQGKGFICWRFINDPIRNIGKHQDEDSPQSQPQRRNEAKFPGKMARMSPHMD